MEVIASQGGSQAEQCNPAEADFASDRMEISMLTLLVPAETAYGHRATDYQRSVWAQVGTKTLT